MGMSDKELEDSFVYGCRFLKLNEIDEALDLFKKCEWYSGRFDLDKRRLIFHNLGVCCYKKEDFDKGCMRCW
tara:strand:- start:5174 stop:5389 length:216 start_codon:yes stop_codon:yes gene_type:complete